MGESSPESSSSAEAIRDGSPELDDLRREKGIDNTHYYFT
jgi:hypothetical protein